MSKIISVKVFGSIFFILLLNIQNQLYGQGATVLQDSIKPDSTELIITWQDGVKPDTEKHKVSFKDSLDGQFDLSDLLINAHGFVPVPVLITEPALGGIGGLLAGVFMQPPAQRVKMNHKGHPILGRPTIMGVGAMYTANNSWGVGGGYTGEWDKIGLIYSVAAAYADVNMDFYRELPLLNKEAHATFNFRAVPVYLSARKTFLDYFGAGLKYVFCYMDVTLSDKDTLQGHYYFNQLVEKVESKKIISRLTPILTFDSRDNIFSPNNGIRIDVQMDWSNKVLGSDFNYIQAGAEGYGYWQVFKPWVASLRLEWEQIFNNPAFYMLPEIQLRGVPAYRYQGNITTLAETEQRVNIYKRWWLVAFGGLAKAFDSYSDFSDADWVYNYGGGFRYLIARKFGLQMGADVGFGPSDWGVYVVFGSGWLRD